MTKKTRLVTFCSSLFVIWFLGLSPIVKAEEKAYVRLGERWPLTVKEGEVGCDFLGTMNRLELKAAFFRYKGKKYALNGLAGSRKSEYLPIEPIWASPEPIWVDNPNRPGEKINIAPPKKNIGPLIDLALEEC